MAIAPRSPAWPLGLSAPGPALYGFASPLQILGLSAANAPALYGFSSLAGFPLGAGVGGAVEEDSIRLLPLMGVGF